MSKTSRAAFVIAGLEVNVYSTTSTTISERKEAVVFFLLHGRYGSAEEVDSTARSVIGQTRDKGRDLLVVTFDQRNHGKRLVSPTANDAWTKERGGRHNERHAQVRYVRHPKYIFQLHPPDLRSLIHSWVAGTARDVSLLIDFLPSYLYPDNKAHPIVEWGVVGISLGGHATWIALANDKRIKTGIPIIGCPDYTRLIAIRAEQTSVSLEGSRYPTSFKDAVERLDPPYLIHENENPFFGKRILVLSGADDQLVPWDASKEFIEGKLEVGSGGLKKVSLYKGVGHECTEGMVQEMAEFIATNCL